MTITLNGMARECPDNCTVAALLAELGLTNGVAVAVNDMIVARAHHDRVLTSGDRLEIVHAVAGG